jgi:hypothetical protein
LKEINIIYWFSASLLHFALDIATFMQATEEGSKETFRREI